ncbi:MAG: glycosyltransferase family 2 protein [Candidatus Cloacimonadales bacterium]|jgi:glycosyltransferase involved in cell wall biosynthesis|nr:glycosyltransferase family 2 protein [Candidatus Cloacimonadota bacterium]MDX9976706.1 glycosyltransferase family 2 protein [Candidatus Cloacimonadales bacterium]
MADLISVIIPAYNAEKLLADSLNSVVNQTYKNFEVIIVNDGSVDKTADICDSFASKDTRIKYTYQDNAGVSMARNKGMEMSSGKYICFLDADDYYSPTYLEKMYLAINKGGGTIFAIAA